MDLTSDDVQDILQLLDGLPFGEMHLRTASFSLWLRRTADGEWTQEMQVLSEPTLTPADPAAGAAGAPGVAAPVAPGAGRAGGGAVAGTTETPGVAGGTAAGAAEAPGVAGGAVAGGAAAGAGTVAPAASAAGPDPDGLRAVCTPLPGTFYRAPMPGAPPFVEVGSRVEPDTVVGIVETMKLMNSVSAGTRGTVAEIRLANAQFAERDTALMWIREEP
jgi:acetyl-CoA carboxylase biotin carboxyl carrier protein